MAFAWLKIVLIIWRSCFLEYLKLILGSTSCHSIGRGTEIFQTILFWWIETRVTTAELLSGRGIRGPYVVLPSLKPVFLETVKHANAQILWKLASPPYLQTICLFCFQMLMFGVLRFLFVLVNMEPYGRKKFKRHLLRNYTADSLPKRYVCILLRRVSTKHAERFLVVMFFRFHKHWKNIAVKVSNDMSPEKYTPDDNI